MDNSSLSTLSLMRQSVGIDIANETFESVLGQEIHGTFPRLSESQRFSNSEPGFAQLRAWIVSQGVDPHACSFVMEATGVYYEALAKWLYEEGYSVVVLLANTVVAFAKSLNIKTKNDQVDARTLAHMGCERTLDTWQPPSAQYKELKQLTRLRQRFVDQRSRVKNQLHAAKKEAPSSAFVIEALEAHIQFLSTQIKKCERQTQALIKSDQQLKKNCELICSIPGFGKVSAATMLAETQGFHAFRNQAQLVSYAGYDVIKRQSGSSIRARERISKKGNHRIRKALFFPALVAPKYIPALQRLYLRILEKNPGIKMKGAVALQRKLLILAFQLCKKQEKYDPQKMK